MVLALASGPMALALALALVALALASKVQALALRSALTIFCHLRRTRGPTTTTKIKFAYEVIECNRQFGLLTSLRLN